MHTSQIWTASLALASVFGLGYAELDAAPHRFNRQLRAKRQLFGGGGSGSGQLSNPFDNGNSGGSSSHHSGDHSGNPFSNGHSGGSSLFSHSDNGGGHGGPGGLGGAASSLLAPLTHGHAPTLGLTSSISSGFSSQSSGFSSFSPQPSSSAPPASSQPLASSSAPASTQPHRGPHNPLGSLLPSELSVVPSAVIPPTHKSTSKHTPTSTDRDAPAPTKKPKPKTRTRTRTRTKHKKPSGGLAGGLGSLVGGVTSKLKPTDTKPTGTADTTSQTKGHPLKNPLGGVSSLVGGVNPTDSGTSQTKKTGPVVTAPPVVGSLVSHIKSEVSKIHSVVPGSGHGNGNGQGLGKGKGNGNGKGKGGLPLSVGGVAGKLTSDMPVLASAIPSIKSKLDQLTNGNLSPSELGSAISSLQGALHSAVPTDMSSLPAVVPSLESALSQALPTSTDSLPQLPSKLPGSLPSAVSSMINHITTDLPKPSEVPKVVDSVISVVTNQLPSVPQLPSIVNSIKSDITANAPAPSNLPSVLKSIVSQITGNVPTSAMPKPLKTVVSDLPGPVKSILSAHIPTVPLTVPGTIQSKLPGPVKSILSGHVPTVLPTTAVTLPGPLESVLPGPVKSVLSGHVPTLPVTLPTVSLPVTLPTLTVPTVQLTLPTKSLLPPLTVPTLPVTLPTLSLPVTLPTVTIPTVQLTLPTESLPVTLPTLPITLPTVTVPTLPTLPITLPTVTVPTLPVTLPTDSLPVTLPTLPVTVPTLPVTVPTLPVTLPTDSLPVTLPTLPVTVPTLPVTVPTNLNSLPLTGGQGKTDNSAAPGPTGTKNTAGGASATPAVAQTGGSPTDTTSPSGSQAAPSAAADSTGSGHPATGKSPSTPAAQASGSPSGKGASTAAHVTPAKQSAAAASAQVTGAPNSIKPIGTNSNTALKVPTSVLFQTSRTAPGPGSSFSHIPASSMPQLIQPPGGIKAQPSNTTLVQVGFNWHLNYAFVANNPNSANQIFAFLPQGVAYGLNIATENVTMHGLMPFDTSKDLHYITTLALAYIPSSMVNTLSLDLHTAVSRIYNNPVASVNALMSMVNPSIAVLADTSLDLPGAGGDNSVPLPANNGSPLNGGGQHKVRTTSVGIGIGVVAGAAFYGAAMFYVARRYKQKTQRHARTSSLGSSDPYRDTVYTSSAGMVHSGGGYGSMLGAGALMSGAWRGGGYANLEGERSSSGSGGGGGGGSGSEGSRWSGGGSGSGGSRSQNSSSARGNISAPVMSENSLGWS